MGSFPIFHILFLPIAAIGFAAYFAPSIVAAVRKHEQLGLVILVNFLVGWSGVGWILTLLWAAGVFRSSGPSNTYR